MKKGSTKLNSIIFIIFYPIIHLITYIIERPKLIGKENIPKKGGFILAGTHVTTLDFLTITYIMYRKIHFLAKIELFNNKILALILRLFGTLPVDRKRKNPDTKDAAITSLLNDEVICLFPEGTINKTNKEIMPFKYGAVSFSYKTDQPIIPFAIIKKENFFDRVYVVIGKPFYATDNIELSNKKLEKEVIKLIRKGKYAKKGK